MLNSLEFILKTLMGFLRLLFLTLNSSAVNWILHERNMLRGRPLQSRDWQFTLGATTPPSSYPIHRLFSPPFHTIPSFSLHFPSVFPFIFTLFFFLLPSLSFRPTHDSHQHYLALLRAISRYSPIPYQPI